VLEPVLLVVPEAPIPPLVPAVLPEVVPPVELPEVVPPVELPDVVPPRLPPEVLLPVEPAVAESSMQSMCTGLFECSFALPVSLFASLPAFGWFRLLQVGLLPVVLVVEVEGEVLDALLLDVDGEVADVAPLCEREALPLAEPLRVADEVLLELPVAVLPLVLPDVWA